MTTPPSLGDLGSTVVSSADPEDDPDPKLPPDPSVRFGKLTAKQTRSFARSGAVTLAVRVNTAGKVVARASAKVGKRARTVASASKTAGRASTVKVTLRLSAAAKRQLKRAGKLKTTIVVSFSGVSSKRTVVLKAPATAKRR
jgi:hypothetical protein